MTIAPDLVAQILRLYTVERWRVGTIARQLNVHHGVVRRVLWQDPVSGADTRHLTIPKGVSGLGAEWHPCHEEIFCLTRDAVAGDAHPFRAGSFLYNPAYAVHGGNRTVNAAETTMLEWHDGLLAINRYTD